jgi:hypothetical protein
MTGFLKRHTYLTRGLMLLALVGVSFFSFESTAQAAGVCNFFPGGGGDLGQCIASSVGKVFAAVFLLLTSVFAIALGWMGSFFNFAMLVTVFQFANFFGNSDGLRLAWGLLRDLANIILLFGFIFIGIQTILDVSHFDVKKTLPALIIAAVLLNFSLFIAEAMVDTANAVAASFYTQVGNIDCSQTGNDVDCANKGLAGHIMHATGITNIFSINGEDVAAIFASKDGVQEVSIWLGVLIFVIVLIGVFFVGSVMLVSRAVTLVILFITSPIAFAGMAIPQLNSMSTKWWGKLVDNILFAPVFVLLMLIGLRLIEGVRQAFVGDGQSLVTALRSSDTSVGGVFILFALVIGFMIAALLSAKEFSLMGSDKVVDGTMKWVANTASTASLGLPLLNAGSRSAANLYSAGIRRVSQTPFIGGLAAGIVVGSGADSAIRGITSAGADLKIPGQTRTYKETQEANEKRLKEIAGDVSLQKKKNALNAAVTKAVKGNSDDLEVLVNTTSLAQLKETSQLKEGTEGVQEIAVAMSSSMFEQAMEDKDISGDVKKKMREARYGDTEVSSGPNKGAPLGLKAILSDAADPTSPYHEASKKKFARWSAADIEKSGILEKKETREKAVQVMSDAQYDGIQASRSIGANAKRELENLRDDPNNAGSRFAAGNVENTFKAGITKPADRAKISPSTLTKPHVMVWLTPADFAAIQKSGNLDPTQRKIMSDYLKDIYSDPTQKPMHDELLAYEASLKKVNGWNRFKNYYNLP